MSRIATLELSEEAVNAVTDHCGDNKRSLAIEEGLRGLQLREHKSPSSEVVDIQFSAFNLSKTFMIQSLLKLTNDVFGIRLKTNQNKQNPPNQPTNKNQTPKQNQTNQQQKYTPKKPHNPQKTNLN